MVNEKKSRKKKVKSGISSSPTVPRNDGTNMKVEVMTPVSVDAKEMSKIAACAK